MPEDLKVMPGILLAAWPDLVDPNFMHTVVLMCQHSDEGAYGLIVNRATELSTKVLLPDHSDLGRIEFPVFFGGPVDHSSMQFVHTVPDDVPGGISLDGRIWLGGDLDALGRYIASDPERARQHVRMFLGYAGWGEGQLETELSIGSWLPAPLAMEALFGEDQEVTWRRVVRSVGGDGADLENHPPDVSWN
ncbi:MAG: YqgE/AlgH family protein [Planctomycetota bacterium]|nr:YqgE/AlgH family protein [Planctomycetota bacterium]